MEYNKFDDFSTKELPFNLEAEQTILGAILIDPDVLPLVLKDISPDCFYNPQHKALFQIITQMFNNSTNTDLITVLNKAVDKGLFDSSNDGKRYLSTLMNLVPSVSNVESYCKIILDKYYLRNLIIIAKEIIQEAGNDYDDSNNLIDSAEQKIFNLRQGKDVQGLVKIDDVISEAYDRLTKITGPDKEKYLGAKTGFTYLDTVTSGLNKSDLIILAARPGMGKTSFALNIGTNVSRHMDKDVAIFSLEMSKEQLVTRMLSSEALVDSNKLRTGRLSSDDWIRLGSSADTLSRLSMYIDDAAGINVQQMKAKLRRMPNLGLVIIDYLQLMSSTLKTDNKVVVISEITRQLKIMAKELNVPIITLSQLSRGPESRTDKRPMLSDLRESGSIEQDADIVMFLYRDSYYNSESEQQNITECIIAKNRHGETGTVELIWDGQFTRFSNPEFQRTD